LLCYTFAEAVQSPDERPITDPQSVSSTANPTAAPLDIKQLFSTHSVSGPAWSPDGKEIVFTTNTTGRLNLWKISSGGGKPVQLSQSDDRELSAAWSPDGQRIAYQQDHGGAETYDVFTISAQGGSSTNLTNTPDISETNPTWSPDGSQIAFDLKPKSSPITNIAVYDCKTRSVRSLTAEKAPNMGWGVGRWSPDGKFLFAVRGDVGYNDSDVFRIDVNSGTAENLTSHRGKVRYGLNGVSPDGKAVLISSNEQGGFSNVALLDVSSKKITSVTHLQWESAPGDFAPDGKSFTYLVNEDGRTELYLADRATLQPQKLNFPAGVSSFGGNPSTFSPQGDRLIVEHQSSQHPPDLWLYDLKSRQSQQLTHSSDTGFQANAIPASQLVHYRSFDGKIISAFIWMPYNLKRDGSNPDLPPFW
jgi:Tol biopolymer transport system component